MRGKEEGITLVALMITIIVLIILAAVTLLTVTNHNIVGKAGTGAEEYAKGQQYELGEINNVTKILGDFENKMSGESETGGEELENPIPIDKDTSYVGYYADIDRDGTVDGIIFVDLVTGSSKETQQWNNDSWSKYEITTISEEITKNYEISIVNYKGSFGTKPVLRPVNETEGKERFYVMALTDIDGGQNGTKYDWYYSAYGKLDNFEPHATKIKIGTGRSNTETMIKQWNNKAYGEQDECSEHKDIWGQIQDKVAKRWFVPSRAEWSAFGGELGVTTENYISYGISNWSWSSSQINTNDAYIAGFDCCEMSRTGIQRPRLGANGYDFLIS